MGKKQSNKIFYVKSNDFKLQYEIIQRIETGGFGSVFIIRK